MKRRNFLKLVPVGLLAAKFGGLVDLLPVKLVKIPFNININYVAIADGESEKDFIDRLFEEIKKSDPVLKIALNLPMDLEYAKSRLESIRSVTYV